MGQTIVEKIAQVHMAEGPNRLVPAVSRTWSGGASQRADHAAPRAGTADVASLASQDAAIAEHSMRGRTSSIV